MTEESFLSGRIEGSRCTRRISSKFGLSAILGFLIVKAEKPLRISVWNRVCGIVIALGGIGLGLEG